MIEENKRYIQEMRKRMIWRTIMKKSRSKIMKGKNFMDQIFRLVQAIRIRELKDKVNSKEQPVLNRYLRLLIGKPIGRNENSKLKRP
ncbi:hypothetical protein Goklo_027869 [Gossypium klotzschianum]|uniref:Uncharacterized protein n=1 Tax=Gossypium klotzschianum TaxID=34286 RepID=A0A7J8TZK3_9ROSI|nr:hypothetical protein [Gossypium klotzschianum]